MTYCITETAIIKIFDLVVRSFFSLPVLNGHINGHSFKKKTSKYDGRFLRKGLILQ